LWSRIGALYVVPEVLLYNPMHFLVLNMLYNYFDLIKQPYRSAKSDTQWVADNTLQSPVIATLYNCCQILFLVYITQAIMLKNVNLECSDEDKSQDKFKLLLLINICL